MDLGLLNYHTTETFVEHLLEKLSYVGIELKDKIYIYHLCVRVDSDELYHEPKNSLISSGNTLVKEGMISGRLISVFDIPSLSLSKRMLYDTLLELPAPKKNHPYKNGLQHIEIVYPGRLESLLETYSQLDRDMSGFTKEVNRDISIMFADLTEVKFHEQSLRTVLTNK